MKNTLTTILSKTMGTLSRFFMLCIPCILCASCSGQSKLSFQLDQFTANFAQKMQKEQELYVFGIGSRVPKLIKAIDFDFDCYEKVDIAEARQKIVICANEMVNCINKDVKLRPYLDRYPFAIKDIDFAISFEKVPEGPLQNIYPAYVLLVNGKIFYTKFSVSEDKYVDIYSETFEEALAKIQLTNCIKSP